MAKSTREQFSDYMHSLLTGETYVPPEEDDNSTRRQFAEYMDNLFGVNMAQEEYEPDNPEPAPTGYPRLHGGGEPKYCPRHQDPLEDLRERLYHDLAW